MMRKMLKKILIIHDICFLPFLPLQAVDIKDI